jgi:hypothetical protein
LHEFWKDFGKLEFLGPGQRRGAHVNTPKIGSRGVLLCFGGISGFCAELRREIIWGNLDLTFFGVLGVVPRRSTEEGGPTCAFGGIYVLIGGGFVKSFNALQGNLGPI